MQDKDYQSSRACAKVEQWVIPTSSETPPPPIESMTFSSESVRLRFIREQRAYGDKVTLRFIARQGNVELYEITREALT